MSLQTRIDELRRRIESEHGAGVFLYSAVYCNGCGRSVSAPSPEKLALIVWNENWQIAGEFGGHDLCPRCRGG